ncbi:hypothetical protein V2I12_03755 [Peribacillus frigoritolerans]|nr:hypothetical protein [Peribacillus frigoritolerans]
MYSEVEDPSIDPVILVKLTFNIASEFVQCVKQLKKLNKYGLPWFLGYGFHGKVPPTQRSG